MALRRGAANAVERSLPTCNPCAGDEHGRCATALGAGYLNVIDSDFECACFANDTPMHKDAADERQDHFEARESAQFRRSGPYREYERWAEEL